MQVVAIEALSAVVFYGFSVQELPVLVYSAVVPLYSVQLAITALVFIIVRRTFKSVYCYVCELISCFCRSLASTRDNRCKRQELMPM